MGSGGGREIIQSRRIGLLLALSALFIAVPAESQEPQATLEVLKLTFPLSDATVFSFGLEGPGTNEVFDLQDGQAETFLLSAGTYTITETVPEDWVLGQIRCGTIFELGPVASGAIRIELEPSESVTCRFENDMVDVPPPPPPPGGVAIPTLSPTAISLLFMALAASGALLLRKSL